MASALLWESDVTGGHARALYVLILSGAVVLSSAALAQVPVADTKRETTETGIARCMTAAQTFNTATVAPTKGTQGSVAAPGAASATQTASVGAGDLTGGAGTAAGAASLTGGGSAGASVASSLSGAPAPAAAQVGSVGTGNLTGGPGAAAGTTSLGSVGSAPLSGSVGGMNFSPLLGGMGGTMGAVPGAAFNVGTAFQVLNAISGVTSALQTNSAALTTAAALIGTINSSQGGWDQNSAARLSATGLWNQTAQVAAVTLQLRNQILLSRAMAAAAAAKAMSGN